MGEKQVPAQKKKFEDQIPAEEKNYERILSLNRNGEHQIPPNKKEINNWKIREETHTKVCIIEESDSVILFTKKNYKVAISLGLTAWHIYPINCDLDNGAGSN